MREYVFEIKITDEDLMGDEMFEEMERDTNSDCVAEIMEAIQKALTGQYTLLPPDADGEEIAKNAVRLVSFRHC